MAILIACEDMPLFFPTNILKLQMRNFKGGRDCRSDASGRQQTIMRPEHPMWQRQHYYWEWKKYDVAIELYNQLVAKHPDDPRFKEDLAAILVESGHFRNAYALLCN